MPGARLHGARELQTMVSHRFPLTSLPQAIALNAGYGEGAVKVIVTSPPMGKTA